MLQRWIMWLPSAQGFARRPSLAKTYNPNHDDDDDDDDDDNDDDNEEQEHEDEETSDMLFSSSTFDTLQRS